jgi:hypothetical protein
MPRSDLAAYPSGGCCLLPAFQHDGGAFRAGRHRYGGLRSRGGARGRAGRPFACAAFPNGRGASVLGTRARVGRRGRRHRGFRRRGRGRNSVGAQRSTAHGPQTHCGDYARDERAQHRAPKLTGVARRPYAPNWSFLRSSHGRARHRHPISRLSHTASIGRNPTYGEIRQRACKSRSKGLSCLAHSGAELRPLPRAATAHSAHGSVPQRRRLICVPN